MNQKLTMAKINKNDEFYTRLEDVENELKYYRKHFEDKIVYCNSDDMENSNFYIYFKENFKFLKLKKLVLTNHSTLNKIYKVEVTKDGTTKTPLKGNGDFRSEECVDILKECDVVVTNPPFSLFRELIDVLFRYDKKFLVLGNINVVSYQKPFALLRDKKMWLGTIGNKTFTFRVPENYKNNKSTFEENGKYWAKVSGITWFTNLTHDGFNQFYLNCSYEMNKDDYPKYTNYDAINIDKIKNIPYDYEGEMGVPITFLTKYNPEEFELIGILKSKPFKTNRTERVVYNFIRRGKSPKKIWFEVGDPEDALLKVNPNKKLPNNYYVDVKDNNVYYMPYARILIKKIKGEK